MNDKSAPEKQKDQDLQIILYREKEKQRFKQRQELLIKLQEQAKPVRLDLDDLARLTKMAWDKAGFEWRNASPEAMEVERQKALKEREVYERLPQETKDKLDDVEVMRNALTAGTERVFEAALARARRWYFGRFMVDIDNIDLSG